MPLKPRLLFLANHYRGPGRSGGARTWHQVRELVKRFQVTLIVPRIDPLTQEELSNAELPKFPGMILKLANCKPGSRKSVFGRIVYQATSAMGTMQKALLTGKTDILLAMGAPPASALVGYLVSRIKHAPIFLDVRDVPLETAEELNLVRYTLLLRIAQKLESIIFRRVDHIVCVSDEMAQFVRARRVPARRVSTNYIGYDNFEKNSANSEDQRTLLLNSLDAKTRFIVFYAGTLATLVDITTVLRAAEQVKTDRRLGFVIVGDGERRPGYQEWARREGLNVHFTGRIPKGRVHDLCAAADACVYPLKGGPAAGAMLGNKIFDYLGAGKPIIYTGPDGAVANLIQRLGAGFVLPEEDAGGLARLVYDLAEDPESFSKMGIQGRNAVLEKMTAAHSARKLSNLLIDSIGKSKE